MQRRWFSPIRFLVVAIAWSILASFARASPAAPWREYLRQTDDWYRQPEGRRLTHNVMTWQSLAGSWPKNTNTAAQPFAGNPQDLQGTFDNGATVQELRFLARAYQATGESMCREAIGRGLRHILQAQYPNGGWPQRFPPGLDYPRHITFNDDTVVGLMELLREAATSPQFGFLEDWRRRAAQAAFNRGRQCILRCQVVLQGERTVWCAQHDEVDLRARGGRAYELASLSGAESARILELLMSLDQPTPEVVRAIEAGVAWFNRAQLTGIRQVVIAGDKTIVPDPLAPPLWARFYDLTNQKPMFVGREGIPQPDLASIEAERRNGYAWYGNWGTRVAQAYRAWKKPAPPESQTPESPRQPQELSWPDLTRDHRPGAYWWWLGSAVDTTNLTRELQRYHDAGLGSVHIIPIYGAKGWEDRFIPYLSERWMKQLAHVTREGQRLDLNIDMTTGSGWCFGGPGVSDLQANALVSFQTVELKPGAALTNRFDKTATQALMAYSSAGGSTNLLSRILPEGRVDWAPGEQAWQIVAVSQRPSGQKVKRAAPGGEGHMLNPFYLAGLQPYLAGFEKAFESYQDPLPRAMYHDSYEYRSDWSPNLLAAFAQRRGYRLEDHLPALISSSPPTSAAWVKGDYRETLSDLLVEETLSLWTSWCREHGFLTRYQAHGSPGNLLDLYALADMPETEMFNRDRSRLVAKFASSAAHVTGRSLVASETGTWLREHFTETFADMKYLLDDLFLSGANHVFYHGTCYSPDEAGWPGWLFYASSEMNPRNAIWRDVPALNRYVARCQSILQSGRPDNDLLVYWPIHDFWNDPKGMVQPMTVHRREWFEGQPIGRLAEHLWQRGYAFDYLSDRQLMNCRARDRTVQAPGGRYRAIVVPRCALMPVATLAKLLELVETGATVIFQDDLPNDVPGWGQHDERRRQLLDLRAKLAPSAPTDPRADRARKRQGSVFVGEVEAGLQQAGIARESLVDQDGLWFIRRQFEGGRHYFLANRGERVVDGWVPLATTARSMVLMDPLTGQTHLACLRSRPPQSTEVYLQLQPGESRILRAFSDRTLTGPQVAGWQPQGPPLPMVGPWQVQFFLGGPERPAPRSLNPLTSWTQWGDTNAERFAGTASYGLVFDAPQSTNDCWVLDLGRVCQSARVRLNGQELGTLIVPPFRLRLPAGGFKPTANHLEIEVTNVSANRIRDLDRRGVPWRNFHDINFVNLDYKPFNAAEWPLTDSGLLGPVRLLPGMMAAPP